MEDRLHINVRTNEIHGSALPRGALNAPSGNGNFFWAEIKEIFVMTVTITANRAPKLTSNSVKSGKKDIIAARTATTDVAKTGIPLELVLPKASGSNLVSLTAFIARAVNDITTNIVVISASKAEIEITFDIHGTEANFVNAAAYIGI